MSRSSSIRQALSKRYTQFADYEARGRSPLYESFARNVAIDPEILDFLLTLPSAKQQPNLLFAAVRFVHGTFEDFRDFKRGLFSKIDAVRSVMLERSTQTNEPARCATLLPILARLPQPLALIEVGASAGLCLLPDFYGYNYGSHELHPEIADAHHPVFACKASAGAPLPTKMPKVVWRAGLDLNPLDAANPDQSSWLETLVWPEQKERLANLRRALRVAVAQKPRIVKGSLTDHSLARLCREAPADATLVVFHTAVLAYVLSEDRRAFSDQIGSLCHAWISNESPRVMPDLSKSAGEPSQAGRFLLSLNREPVAWTDPHGAAIEWIHGTQRCLGSAVG